MKLASRLYNSMAVCALATHSIQAWTPATASPRPFSSSSLNSVVATNQEVVSFFRGGLAAIRVRDAVQTDSNDSSQSDDLMGHQVIFPNGAVGMVVAQRHPVLFVYMDMQELDESTDGSIQVLDSMAQVSVDHATRTVDCFGQAQPECTSPTTPRDIYADIPQVKDIALINKPMLTGTTMVDALAPIGKGQNMLVIGSNVEEMRGFCLDMVTTQVKEGNTKCIYATTQPNSDVQSQLSDDVILVAARDTTDSTDPVARAAEATAVAATACAVAESFALDHGEDALVIVDTIDDYKVLWDATTRTLVNVFGVDAVVKDDVEGGASSEMRAYYSSLMQRAGQFKLSKGGGSVTLVLMRTIPASLEDEETVFDVSDFDDCSAKIKDRLQLLVNKKIPLTAANLKKIEIPIPSASEGRRRLMLQHVDDLISMSDGQIWLDDTLAHAGQCPPMDPQRSITRVGIGADTASRADAPAVRRMVEGLRLDLAQAASMDGAEATVASAKQIRKRRAWLLAMHQEAGQGGRTLSQSCVALLAASIGALDDTIDAGGLAGTANGHSVMTGLLEHVASVAPDAVKEIDESLDISPTGRATLVDAIESYFS